MKLNDVLLDSVVLIDTLVLVYLCRQAIYFQKRLDNQLEIDANLTEFMNCQSKLNRDFNTRMSELAKNEERMLAVLDSMNKDLYHVTNNVNSMITGKEEKNGN